MFIKNDVLINPAETLNPNQFPFPRKHYAASDGKRRSPSDVPCTSRPRHPHPPAALERLHGDHCMDTGGAPPHLHS